MEKYNEIFEDLKRKGLLDKIPNHELRIFLISVLMILIRGKGDVAIPNLFIIETFRQGKPVKKNCL